MSDLHIVIPPESLWKLFSTSSEHVNERRCLRNPSFGSRNRYTRQLQKSYVALRLYRSLQLSKNTKSQQRGRSGSPFCLLIKSKHVGPLTWLVHSCCADGGDMPVERQQRLQTRSVVSTRRESLHSVVQSTGERTL